MRLFILIYAAIRNCSFKVASTQMEVTASLLTVNLMGCAPFQKLLGER